MTTTFGLPDTLTWASVMGTVSDFLAQNVVSTGIMVSIALVFGPKIIKAFKKSVLGK